jgi:hypothetical protein
LDKELLALSVVLLTHFWTKELLQVFIRFASTASTSTADSNAGVTSTARLQKKTSGQVHLTAWNQLSGCLSHLVQVACSTQPA